MNRYLIIGVLSVVSFFSSYILSKKTLPIFTKKGLVSKNYHREDIPNSAGCIFIISAFLYVIPGIVLEIMPLFEGVLYLAVSLGAGLIGWIDDRNDDGQIKGFKGHFKALIYERQVTSGMIKTIGGIFAGLVTGVAINGIGYSAILAGAIIALSMNTINLFDLRPGRAGKVFIMFFILITIFITVEQSNLFVLFLPLIAAVLGYLPFDLKSRAMMGDTGANALGALLGLYSVLALGVTYQIIYLVIILGITYTSEKVSFTDLIEKNRLLCLFDKAGRYK